jgi:phosphatidylglycerol:prolipoprotein diacylglycerol transferase
LIAYVIEWGWFKIGSYGIMMALGFLCAWYLFRLELKRKGLDPEIASRITFNAAIWGVIGGRLASILEEPGHLLENPVRMLLLEGGLTWYGGLAFGAAATFYTIVKVKAPMIRVFDAMGPAGLVGYSFGRGGCLLSGDGCYGTATDLPWGMQFPKLAETPGFHCMQQGGIAQWPPIDPTTCTDAASLSTCERYCDQAANRADCLSNLSVHPTPLYEIVASLACFGVMWAFRKKINRSGMMLGFFFLANGVPRFFIEMIRLNPRYLGLSLSQWLAIVLLAVGSALVWRSFKQPQPETVKVEDRPAKGKRRHKS